MISWNLSRKTQIEELSKKKVESEKKILFHDHMTQREKKLYFKKVIVKKKKKNRIKKIKKFIKQTIFISNYMLISIENSEAI